MAFFVCTLIACLALYLTSFADKDFLDAHGRQGVFVRLGKESGGEIVPWKTGPVLTFGGEETDVSVASGLKRKIVATASVEASHFCVQCSRDYENCVEHQRGETVVLLKSEDVMLLQDQDILRFKLGEKPQEYRFLIGDLKETQIGEKIRGKGSSC